MYFYLSNKDSSNIYPNNNNIDFTVDLAQPVILENIDEWEIAVVEIDAPFYTKPGATDKVNYYILSDIADFSFVAGNNYPVLRKTLTPASSTATSSLNGTIFRSNGSVDRTISITSSEQAAADRYLQVYDTPFYIPVRQHYIERIRIYLRSIEFDELASTADNIFVTLHLRRKTYVESLESSQKHIGGV